jgi:hypothetical protein
MAFQNDGLVPTAIAAHQASVDHAGTQTTLIALVAADIAVATSAGNFSCTVSVSGQASNDVQYVIELLRNEGYTATLSGTTLTISW